MSAPTVSIVIATYDSSHLLRHAIASVRLQDFEDWELIVVGDHCTDDTEECVASFADERIRFVNLERNSGQQATPNNVGVGMARGRYLAFLNHDDMYLPHHLSSGLARIRDAGADILCVPFAVIEPEQLDRMEAREVVATPGGFKRSGRFSPYAFHVASSWLFRRELADEIGPWRLEKECFVTPSQDWLFRVWRAGKHILCSEEVSLVVIYSGSRKNSYRRKESPEHDFVFRDIVASERLRGEMLRSLHQQMDGKRAKPRTSDPFGLLKRGIRKGLGSLLIRADMHPNSARMLRWGGRGGFIKRLKKTTG